MPQIPLFLPKRDDRASRRDPSAVPSNPPSDFCIWSFDLVLADSGHNAFAPLSFLPFFCRISTPPFFHAFPYIARMRLAHIAFLLSCTFSFSQAANVLRQAKRDDIVNRIKYPRALRPRQSAPSCSTVRDKNGQCCEKAALNSDGTCCPLGSTYGTDCSTDIACCEGGVIYSQNVFGGDVCW